MLWSKPLLWIGCAAAWTIDKGAVGVSGGGDVADRVPFSKLDGPVEMFGGRALDIAFKVPETPSPHQIAVRISIADEVTGSKKDAEHVDKTVLAKMRGNNAKIVLPFKSIPKEMINYPLKASALISGSADEPVEIELFDLIVYGDDDNKLPPVRSVGAGKDLEGKPEIYYEFRAPPRHANPVLAIMAVVAIDILFSVLLMSWNSTVKLNFQLLLQNPGRVALLVSSILLELAFVGYYVSWSIFRLLAVSAVLLPMLIITANRAF